MLETACARRIVPLFFGYTRLSCRRFLGGQHGGPKFPECILARRTGRTDAGNRVQGDFLAPSPSANLVGHGKGDPLGLPLGRDVSTVAPTQPHRRVRMGIPCPTAMHFGDIAMTSTLLSPAGVAVFFAHLLMLGASLVLKGLALQKRPLAQRLLLGLASLALAATAFVLAETWAERGVLLVAGLWMAPVLYGVVVIRAN